MFLESWQQQGDICVFGWPYQSREKVNVADKYTREDISKNVHFGRFRD
jgi:hypothetical protein